MSRLNYESAHNKSNKMAERVSIDTQIRLPTCPGNADIADIGISVKEPCTSWQYQQMAGYVSMGTQIRMNNCPGNSDMFMGQFMVKQTK